MASEPRQRTRRAVQKVVGQILPGALYTREGAMRFAGIGHNALGEARRSGIVKPIPCGRRMYYRGAELIEWIENSVDTENG